MKKKLILLLLAILTIIWNVFSSEYQEERNLSDVVLIQNTEGKCFVLYKTDDSEVSMYVENHFDENDCGKENFFAETKKIKATSSFFKKDKNGYDFVCFTGTDFESEMEEDKLFIFMTGIDYTGYYSKVISFSKQDNIVLKDFVISDSNEIIVYLLINGNLLCKKINIQSDSISDNYLFSGYPIDDFKIMKNTECNELLYGIFISNNNFYAFVLNDAEENIINIMNNDKLYYLFDEFNPVCFCYDGQIFTKISFTDVINYKTMSIELDTDSIRDIFGFDNKINIITRDNENIYVITTDQNLQSFEKQILCSNKNNPFIYVEKNKYFNDSIVIIVKDIGIFKYSNNSWNLFIDYSNIIPYINQKLFDISISNERNFEIKMDKNFKDGLFYYVVKLNKLTTIPLYKNNEEDFDVMENSSSINGLFYSFLKKAEKVYIVSRVN